MQHLARTDQVRVGAEDGPVRGEPARPLTGDLPWTGSARQVRGGDRPQASHPGAPRRLPASASVPVPAPDGARAWRAAAREPAAAAREPASRARQGPAAGCRSATPGQARSLPQARRARSRRRHRGTGARRARQRPPPAGTRRPAAPGVPTARPSARRHRAAPRRGRPAARPRPRRRGTTAQRWPASPPRRPHRPARPSRSGRTDRCARRDMSGRASTRTAASPVMSAALPSCLIRAFAFICVCLRPADLASQPGRGTVWTTGNVRVGP